MYLPMYSISPEEIFKGDILLFDIDFFNPQDNIMVKTKVVQDNNGQEVEVGENEYDLKNFDVTTLPENEKVKYYFYRDENNQEVVTSRQNTSLELQSLVSQWYTAIRNIAIVLSMSVLLYVGIRMMLSTLAQDKAKYKQMLMDWVVSICLLFFMHYLMAFSVYLVNTFTDMINSANAETEETGQIYSLQDDENGYISQKIKDMGLPESEFIDTSTDPATILWPTNVMGSMRLRAQVSYGDLAFAGYSLCFIILVLLTVYFVYIYMKRVLYMAFLTMIAPLVALTYPIDKISDGQAQAFNKWLKEYIFNLLIQPLHLLLYTVLITSAFELSSQNMLYTLVAIGFLIPAEKIMRSLFGFEKATTPPSMAGVAVGASLLNTGLQKVLHSGPAKKGGNSGSGSSGDGSNSSSSNVGNHSRDLLSAFLNGNDGNPNGSQGGSADTSGMDNSIDDSDDSSGGDDSGGAGSTAKAVAKMAGKGVKKIAGATGRVVKGAVSKVPGLANTAMKIKNSPVGTVAGTTGKLTGDALKAYANTKSGKRVISTVRGTKDVAKYFARRGIDKAKTGIPKAIRTGVSKAPSIAAGAALGVTAGALGTGLAIASGDPGNLLTYGGGGALAGATLGKVGFNVSPRDTKSATQIAAERAFFGDEEYEKREQEKAKKDWKKDLDKREELEQHLGPQKVKELYRSKEIDYYIDNGITDTKTIVAMEKVREKHKDEDLDKMISYQQARDISGNGSKKMDGKKRGEMISDYKSQFMDRGVNEKSAENTAKHIAKMVDEINVEYGKL